MIRLQERRMIRDVKTKKEQKRKNKIIFHFKWMQETVSLPYIMVPYLSNSVTHEQYTVKTGEYMKLCLQSLFGLHVHSCPPWLRPSKPLPLPRIWAHKRGHYCLLVGQDRRHLSVTSDILVYWYWVVGAKILLWLHSIPKITSPRLCSLMRVFFRKRRNSS